MDQLSMTFQALSDPTRRSILERLSRGSASVSELAEPFDMSGPAITKHLKVLERAGLITREKEAQFRPSKLNGAPLKEAQVWMEKYRTFWEQSFDRLEVYLDSINSKDKKKKRERYGRKKQAE